jgi:acyl-CoA thioesterase FadM
VSGAEQIFWRGVFNAWHIGLGGHINIKHYAQALDDARAIAALRQGDGPAELGELGLCTRPVLDRMDFRKELAPGDAVRIHAVSGRDEAGDGALNGSMLAEPDSALIMRFQTSYGLIDPETGDRAAWDKVPSSRIDPLRALRPIPEPMMPSHPPINAWTTWQGTVEVGECDHHGLMTPRAVYDLITRGLWAVHIRLGRHRDTLKQTGGAGGVTAIQVRHGTPARMGDLLEVRTSLLGLSANSLRMGHLIRNQVTGTAVAQVEYVNTFFSRTTGKKQPPDSAYLDGIMDIRLSAS